MSSRTNAFIQLSSPDGYYSYFGIEKPAPTEEYPQGIPLEEDTIKKIYRKLSLKHHPDRPTGDAETFRLLNRAQKVLSNPKLRQQYDLLGLDLEDDEEDTPIPGADETDGSTPPSEHHANSPESIINQIASITIASIFQVILRTVMMAVVATVVVRFRWTLYPAILFLVFVAYRVRASSGSMDALAPLMICFGIILMHRGRDDDRDLPWSWTFWVGEALVMTMFAYNSIPPDTARTPTIGMVLFVASTVLTLLLRGKLWNYATAVVMEGFVVLVAIIGFPMMEMLLERILNEKLRKIGEKIRAHNARMKDYYTNANQ